MHRIITTTIVSFGALLGIIALSAVPALAAAPEAPLTEAVTANTGTSVTFNGTANPGTSHEAAQEGAYVFLYKKGAAGCEGESATAGGFLAGLGPEQVTPEPTAVEPNTKYEVCLAATNLTSETTVGNAVPVKTNALPPTIVSESAPAPKATGATLHATINPNNQATKYQFEYSTKEKAGKLEAPIIKVPVTAGTIPAAFEEHGVEVGTEVLLAGTVYYYRVVAENAQSKTEPHPAEGKVQSFLTGPPETPVEAKVKADSTTASSVEVEGVLNPGKPGESGSSYEFLYNTGTGCVGGKAAPEPAAEGQGHAKERVSQTIGGLQPNSEYTVCLTAHNSAGEASALGGSVTFSTHAGVPVIESPTVKNVTETTATIAAKVNPEGLDTHVYVEYGEEQDTAPLDIGAVVGAQEVSFALKGLKAGTPYHFHVVAFNSAGTAESPPAEFKTFKTPATRLHGESPWWGITTGSRPTDLRTGVASNSVQEIAVTPEEFEGEPGVIISIEGSSFYSKVFVELYKKFGVELPELTAANVQKALESVAAFGQGTVVTEHPGGTAFVVTNPGKKTPKLEVTASFGQATVNVISEGERSGQLVVEAENRGDAAARGCSAVPAGQGKYTEAECNTPAGSASEGVFEKTPVTITDTLPEGLRAVAAEGIAGEERDNQRGVVSCKIATSGKEVTCTFGETPEPGCGQLSHLPCAPTIPAFEQIEVLISVVVGANAKTGEKSGEVNAATVSGGGASGVRTATHEIEVEGSERFGVEDYSLTPEQLGGAVDTQAGSHPFQLTTVVNANTKYNTTTREWLSYPRTVALVKDNIGELPAGLVGNPTPFEQCTDAQFATFAPKPAGEEYSKEGLTISAGHDCPASSAVGVALVHYALIGAFGGIEERKIPTPIFNMVPLHGEPARFGFWAGANESIPITLSASVRTGGDYGVTVASHSIVQIDWLDSVKLTFWGVPGSPLHDRQRGRECIFAYGTCGTSTSSSPPPFLTMPTSCGAFRSTLLADSWPYEGKESEVAKPATYELEENGHPLSVNGCNHLPFTPSLEVKPDVPNASTSTGLTVKLHLPQTAELNPEGLAESSLRDTTVTLPAGVAVNPSGADGLEACSEGLVGYLPGESNPPDSLHFTPRKPGSVGTEGGEATLQPGVNFCPNASKIGTVDIASPLLPKGQDVTGSVYLADQNSNPFGSLIAMYAVAEDPISGTLIKLPFNVSLNQSTGQLVATSDNSPQLPFENAEFHFFGGERAPLATPSRCGSYTTQASFTPWSAESGEAPHTAESTFNITSGPSGSPCRYPGQALPFNPTLTGGATNVNAGVFSPFTATMSRKDGEQNLQSLEVHLPPGLSGVLSGVELCPEPRANLGECGPNSLIGETTVSVGVGGDPFSVEGGKFYLTGPYNGSGACTVGTSGCAPFGITFEVPGKAGPFDLERNAANPAGEDACDCVIVRGKIEINPLTSAITITSNPPGTPYAIPTSIEGIPLEIQHVNAITTRSNFQFNPTNCAKMEFTGAIHSSENGIDTIGVPFQVTNCRSLAFTPKFKVSVGAKTSKADGASLSTTVTEPAGSLGTQSNLAKVKVELPRDLPSRLTTLQKACTSKQFELNPANCPKESKIGYAKVITPLVPVPLEGPAIFVSHGGEAFPSLTMVLQGYGVTIDLVGTTFISKSGVTSTTFKTVPDQPFSSFTLTLPTGKFSALTALGNVCAEKLSMPTEFIAQNGAEIHQVTPISVTGCKKLTPAQVRAQKLKAALASCRKQDKHHKARREACERTAHKRFGPVKKSKRGKK